MDEQEAKLRKGLTAGPLDIAGRVPYVHQEYPRMVYHPDGRHRIAEDAMQYQAALDAGWLNDPQDVHLAKFQGSTFAGAPVSGLPAPDSGFEVHPGAAVAVEKQRKAEEKRKEKK